MQACSSEGQKRVSGGRAKGWGWALGAFCEHGSKLCEGFLSEAMVWRKQPQVSCVASIVPDKVVHVSVCVRYL